MFRQPCLGSALRLLDEGMLTDWIIQFYSTHFSASLGDAIHVASPRTCTCRTPVRNALSKAPLGSLRDLRGHVHCSGALQGGNAASGWAKGAEGAGDGGLLGVVVR